ncbi:hypothetical protein GCM10007425_17000 [Lysinibacillus alkalisoli]|uniref:DUF1269 domain-containing protein n=1 Tax=Lysinibacillus alkalisoli TaxID=1911548 RepID=A0A917G521_9BACI|nr:DUF1269 domain-containing protein [Lysinibacillus alkalisoli]GGG23074.1 hypothetical protein GCM10007425_17000 [Lysinibacillus alkalisoli]
MEKRVIIMTFKENSQAYEAFSKLKVLHAEGKVEIEQLAVVENAKDQGFLVQDAIDLTGSDRFFAGGLIGAFVGILGGPLGMLLGWTTGSIIGNISDIDEVKGAISTFKQTSSVLTEETVGVLAIASEFTEHVIDELVKEEFGGEVVRFSAAAVEAEIEEARQAEKALKREARKHWIKDKFTHNDEEKEA